MARDDTPPGFVRDFYRDGGRTLIKSTCEYCGTVIIDSVPDLSAGEWEHRSECAQPKSAKSLG